jgi:putative ABC transport system permease protein
MPPPPGRQVGYSGQILVTWGLAVGTFALAIFTTMLASVYPAWKGSRLEIVDALRHNR